MGTLRHKGNKGEVVKNYLPLFVGIAIGLLIYHIFFKPETDTITEYRETIKTDTVYVTHREIITQKGRIEHRVIRDTVIKEFKPKISHFKAVYPTVVGNAYLNGEVLGEVLKTDLRTDFRLPVITNTITKEKTVNKNIIQRGFFVGGGINNVFDYNVGAAYLGRGFLINADYTPKTELVSVGVKVNLFK